MMENELKREKFNKMLDQVDEHGFIPGRMIDYDGEANDPMMDDLERRKQLEQLVKPSNASSNWWKAPANFKNYGKD